MDEQCESTVLATECHSKSKGSDSVEETWSTTPWTGWKIELKNEIDSLYTESS